MESLKLIRERGQLRRLFTRSAQTIEAAIAANDFQKVIVDVEMLRERMCQLEHLDKSIQSKMLESETFDEKAYEEETDTAETYKYRWTRINHLMKAGLPSLLVGEKTEDLKKTVRNYKLPPITFKHFDDQPLNWLGFWGQFRKIHEDSCLSGEDKFQYLIQATKEGSNSRSLVESFPPSAENYQKAVDQLRERFGRDDILIQVYVRQLLQLILNHNKNQVSVKTLYDKLSTYLLSLETLGIIKQKYETILYPLVESAIPESILVAWNRSNTDQSTDQLAKLLKFLKCEVESEERIKLARSDFGCASANPSFTAESSLPTAAVLTSNVKLSNGKGIQNNNVCCFCDKGNHNIFECNKANMMSLQAKTEAIRRKGCCYICLRKGHVASKCKAFVQCLCCKKRHLVIMCPEVHKTGVNKTSENVTCARNITTTILQTLTVNITNNGKTMKVRAFIDGGAMRTYVKAALTKKLGLQPTGTERLGHTLFGGVEEPDQVYKCFEIQVSDVNNSFTTQLRALQRTDALCGHLPKIQDVTLLKKLEEMNIKISDTDINDTEISLLIGSDFIGSISTGNLVHLDNNLIAVNTKLGWTLQGPISIQRTVTANTLSVSCFSKANLEDLWSLELLGIKDPYEKQTKTDTQCDILNMFNNNISVNAEGRYEVSLLWKEGCPELQTNYEVACKRLQSTTKKLKSTGNLNIYSQVLEEWKKADIIEMVTDDDNTKGHYIPHHSVIKPTSSSTRVRPVFDASTKTFTKDKNGWSLNDCLEKGINMIELLPRLLIQFRKGIFGVVSDIKQAFLQISITENDRDSLKFLWWENVETCDKMVTYRHKRVVFGITCSPFLLSATIRHHLGKYTDNYKETAKKLKECFYVDNCIASFDSFKELNTFITEAKAIMAEGMFDLRGWVTAPHRIDDTVSISVLGLMWDTQRDELHCNVNINEIIPEKITKRYVISVTQHVFDPLGFVCPTTLIPKLIMQRIWEQRVGWDEEVPTDLALEFKNWLKTAHLINQCRFPRCMSTRPVEKCETSLHIFCDASQTSYASCIFIRTQQQKNVDVQLVMAKNRVAPANKKMSLPRLELMGALIATRLYKEIIDSGLLNKCNKYKVYFWTDSAVVLAWIKRQAEWKPFVSNRVKEICKTTDRNDWHHIPGDVNPADLPSRGCSARSLLDSKWQEGPAWLKCSIEDWPKSKIDNCDEELVSVEKSQRVLVNTQAIQEEPFSQKLMHFSKYNKIVRVVAWILRWSCNVRRKYNIKQVDITNDEYENAEKALIKLLQKENFTQGRIPNKLNTKVDDDGILRVRTRLELSQEDKGFINPILLPGKNEIVERLVKQRHEKLNHAGTQLLMSELRNGFWILNIRRLTKRVVSKCVICKRDKCKHYEVPEAPLPADRIEATAAFQITGIDLAGPLYLRDEGKCWIVLFTCATYRAVHLELVESLSTNSMLMALRRFIARRGRINIIFTDNGTNFQGCANLLREVKWSEIESATATISPPIKWRFIPPRAPWWGGWWERLIRVVKDMLRRILGKESVTYIELSTLLCDCEAVINNRPLTYVVATDDSLKSLTPMMFLQPLASNETPDLDQLDSVNLNARLQYLQKLRHDYRQRFRNEYLALLCSKDRCRPNFPKVNDVVLVETESKRLFWPLGIVTQLFTGADGQSRMAKVRTATGEWVRAVQRLYPLELTAVTQEWHSTPKDKGKPVHTNHVEDDVGSGAAMGSDLPDNTSQPTCITRHGRSVKLPRRFFD